MAEVRRRSVPQPVSKALDGTDVVAFTRRKVEPMVRGLFSRAEQDLGLALLERAVVFLTAAHVEAVLRESSWLCTAQGGSATGAASGS